MTVDAFVAAAEQAARAWGLARPQLVRVGENAVFSCGDVILRVGVPAVPIARAVALADLLTARGVLVARPARHDWIESADGLTVSAWERVEVDPDRPVDWERVGGMIAAVHRIEPAAIAPSLPFCGDSPIWQFESSLDTDIVDGDTRSVLRAVYERHRWWYDAARHARLVLCHGDVHPGNVLSTAAGPVLIDWDLLCVGPAEWDHAPLMTWTERWGGEPGIYEAFAAGYDLPVDAAMATALAELRLLAATLMRFRRAGSDSAQGVEAARRMGYWRGEIDPAVWRAQ